MAPHREGLIEEPLLEPDGLMVIPERDLCGTAVLLVAGSSGAVDVERARVLAAHGAIVRAIRWFGGRGQPSTTALVPLETFTAALDVLAPECDRLAMVGTSFGAEAALLVATGDSRLDAVVAFSPTSVVWPGIVEGRQVSHWTRQGEPLPFTPLDPAWEPREDPPEFVSLYSSSLPRATRDAEIEVEAIRADLLLVAGGDDRVWPSMEFVRRIAQRRAAAGFRTTVVAHEGAGHRCLLPGEIPQQRGPSLSRGGSPSADAELGTTVWPHLVEILRLHPDPDG